MTSWQSRIYHPSPKTSMPQSLDPIKMFTLHGKRALPILHYLDCPSLVTRILKNRELSSARVRKMRRKRKLERC